MEELLDTGLGSVRVFLKRDDNKARKLRYNLGHPRVLTFGGAWSNHIRAVAAAGLRHGFATIGVIRGEERLPLNPSLAYAASCGMTLAYLDRGTYRRKHTPEVEAALRERWGDVLILPEGGSNAAAVRGCAELPPEIEAEFEAATWTEFEAATGTGAEAGTGGGYDVVCCPVGTGGTLAGIAAGLPAGRRALGFAVLKGGGFLTAEVARLQREAYGRVWDNWSIDLDHHFGGYARTTPELRAFAARHGVEELYVAKMLFGIVARARGGGFAPGTRVVAVVTGEPFPPR
ncbi:1-aminocyclopropane-1-carboxylate deaminase/D-cysteine desulfhydrase [Nonomuraea sp. SMC257]|uniref:1-aminocyclopropane-1-carboxylate deaminase/D-cysteine desulfhydrase n=1 Tax=Nonomuraea montanisoli TaxID=2741721 RepID=A0A7Y6I524_9ACTN|nr:1-aminocyclopropane-1-carboxylate deaminase/D-cysteine desulfhydrase [Nonomuraea montanisoli]NUW31679.1 1-aminocyclopropane-1-carboxylate deaminase/D-cysteine desulfhydrase [Nonomuraea montanisoli]